MQKFLNTISIVLIGAGMMSSCSPTSSSTVGVSLSAGGSAAKAVTTALNLDNMLPTTTSRSLSDYSEENFGAYGTGLSAVWTTTNQNFVNEKTDPSTTTSMKEFMGIQLDDNAARPNGSAINIFGRVNNAAMIACIIMTASSVSDSASLVGTSNSITMDASTLAALNSACKINSETQTQISGKSFGLVHTAPSSTLIFDVKTAITMPAEMGGGTQYVYLKWGSGADIAIAANEDNSNGRTRTIATYNTTTKILRAEYITKSKGDGYNFTVHRLYKDETSGVARIFTQIRSGFSTATANDFTSNLSYILDGNINDTPTTANLNFAIDYNQGATGTFEACVKKSDGSLLADPSVTANEFTCTNSGGTGGRATAYATFITAVNTATIQPVPTWHEFTNAPSLLWSTPDNMLTTGI
jgi:hypothetical protein